MEMFNLSGLEKIAEWKKFRDSLETIDDPYTACAKFWAQAPFVNLTLNPFCSNKWPNPWELVTQSNYDNLAIAVGMLYTLKLTDRFSNSLFEIVMSNHQEKNNKEFYLVIDNNYVLNYWYSETVTVSTIDLSCTSTIFSCTHDTKY